MVSGVASVRPQPHKCARAHKATPEQTTEYNFTFLASGALEWCLEALRWCKLVPDHYFSLRKDLNASDPVKLDWRDVLGGGWRVEACSSGWFRQGEKGDRTAGRQR